MDFVIIYILVITVIATVVRSALGFGESLIAVPLFIFFIPIEIAVPLSVLASILIAAIVVIQDRNKIHLHSAKWLIVFATLGIPFGLWLLIQGNENLIKSGLGILIVLYSIYSLFSKNPYKLEKDNKIWLFICGFLSGVFGGAYGLNGPPLVIYGNMRSWTPGQFRATLQAYFLIASTLGMLGYWYKGLWNTTVSYYFLISIPVIIPAVFLGRYLNHKIKDNTFIQYIYVALICIGALLIIQSFM